ncbi:hypothetical protein GCM10010112_62680 [Actinoplanes lobatus]|uniref:Uncharacterized protein n=1 Tax=Actinoplanes lobatus TaxID=113568 RepID=A0A7W7HKG6_9ACTN|nr:hypothetical protein [Actinoplanes lobatus]MBB4752188.1 hypothetical protein [Actinoplanes lobatus]GGN83885.1 hypothetical protein GCM10010112_62680 [Actinoplanes lobatus]GIE45449.1 hypothetical protein Alo02nite_83470 [Actinoplanes lobatus]
MTSRLRDRATSPYVVARPPATPAPDRWTVVVDERGEPVTVLTPAGAEVAFVVADGETPVAAVLSLLEPDDVVVLTSAGTVSGVWAGDDLVDAVMAGPSRFTTDMRLPGEVRIPEVRRRCRYTEDGAVCDHRMSFPERPRELPECGNPQRLAAHRFGW